MRKIAILIFAVALIGCQSTSQTATRVSAEQNEAILKNTNDSQGLIDFYKSQILEDDTPEQRYKLADAYLEINDAESALFYLNPLIEESRLSSEGYYLHGRALALQGDYLEARYAVTEAIVRDSNFASAYNFLGVIDAEHGRFDDARESFNQARALLFSDVVIKNNLAVLDIYQQNYESALHRLLPLWSNGHGDEQIRANLLLTMAKLGYYEDFRALASYETEEFAVIDLYQALADSAPRSFSHE